MKGSTFWSLNAIAWHAHLLVRRVQLLGPHRIGCRATWNATWYIKPSMSNEKFCFQGRPSSIIHKTIPISEKEVKKFNVNQRLLFQGFVYAFLVGTKFLLRLEWIKNYLITNQHIICYTNLKLFRGKIRWNKGTSSNLYHSPSGHPQLPHPPREPLHLNTRCLSYFLIITPCLINWLIWVPSDIWPSPPLIQVDIVEKRAPQRVKGKYIWVADYYKESLSSCYRHYEVEERFGFSFYLMGA